VVDEAVGEAATEARGGAGREGDVAVAQAQHAVRGLEALPVVRGGATQHDALQLRAPAAAAVSAAAPAPGGQRDGRRVGAHHAARRRAVPVPAMPLPPRLGKVTLVRAHHHDSIRIGHHMERFGSNTL